MKLVESFFKKRNLIAVFFLISLIISFSGFLYYSNEEQVIRNEKFNDLNAIAKIKINEINQWRKERLSEANFFSQNQLLIENTKKLNSNINSEAAKEYFAKTLGPIQKTHNYENIFLVDKNNRIVFSLIPEFNLLDSTTISFIGHTFKMDQVLFSDSYYCETDQKIHYDLMAPVCIASGECIAVLVFRLDPSITLYPKFSKWPMPNKTAETLIVRAEGDSVLYLTDLLFLKNPDMSLKIPIDNKDFLAVKAIKGERGIVDGLDYRNQEVLGSIVPVENSNWIMIAKIDKDEIFEELWYHAAITISFSIISILFIGAGFAFTYKYRQSSTFKELFNKEKQLRENIELFKTTLYSIGDGVITTDSSGNVQHLNSVAEKLTGWKENEAVNKKIEEIFNIVNEESGEKVENPVNKVLENGYAVGLANHTLLISKYGEETAIADSGSPIRNKDGEIIGVVLVFQDQTLSRETNRKLEESRQLLLESQKVAQLGNFVWDINTGLWESSEILDEIFGINEEFNRNLEGWVNIVHPDWREEMSNYVADDILIKHKKFDKIYKIRSVDSGREKWVHGLAELRYDKNNQPIKLIGTIADVTERKNNESILIESEKKFRLLYNNAPVSYQSLDPNANIIDVNPTWLSTLGYKREEVLGRNFAEFMTPKSAELIKTRFPYFVEKGEIHNFEFEMVKKNGEHIFVSYEGKIGYDELGIFRQTHCVFTDITERMKAEKIIEESRAKLNSIYNTAPIGIGLLINNKLEEVNETFCIITGYSHEELIKSDLKFLYETKKEYDFIRSKLDNINNDSSGTFTLEWKRKDGSSVDILFSYTMLFEDDPSKGITFTALDISEETQNIKSLAESEERYRSLFERHSVIKMIIDPSSGKIIKANKAASDFYGWSIDDLSKMTIHDINAFDRENVDLTISKILEKKNINLETKHRLADGSIKDVEVFTGIIVSQGKELIYSIIHDVTNEKMALEKLSENEEKMRVIVEGTPNLFFYTQDTNGNITYISPSVEQITGYSIEQWYNQTHWFASENELNNYTVERTHAHLKGDFTDGPLILEIKHANHDLITLEIYENPIIKNGEVIGLQGVAHDITDRRRKEEKIIEQEEHTRAIFNASPLAMILLDETTSLVSVNKSVEKIFNKEAEELLDLQPGDALNCVVSYNNERGCGSIEDCKICQMRLSVKEVFETWQPIKNREVNVTFVFNDEPVNMWLDLSAEPLMLNNKKHVIVGFIDITEKKKSELLLIENERNFRSLVESTQAIPWRINLKNNKFVYIGNQIENLLGYETDLWTDINFWAERVFEEDRNYAVDFCSQATSNGEDHSIEYRAVSKDGKIIWINDVISVLKDDAGKPTELIGFMFDITDSKNKEIRLKHSEERFRGMTEQSLVGIGIMQNNKMIYVNEAYANAMGHTKENILGMDNGEVFNLIHPHDREYAKNQAIKKQRGDKDVNPSYNIRFVGRDGSIKTVTNWSKTIIYEGEKAILSTFLDISKQVEAQAKLKESEEKYRIVADNTYDWEYWLDPYSNFIYISPSVKNITGYSINDFFENKDLMYDIIIDEDKEKVKNHLLGESFEELETEIIEFRIKSKSGDIKWIGHRCNKVYSDDHEFAGRRASNRDITELKTKETELKASEERFKGLFENATLGIYRGTIDGKLIICNQALLNILGYESVEDLKKINSDELYVDPSEQKLFRDIILKEDEISGYEQKFYKADKSIIIVNESTKLLRDENGNPKYLEGIIEDVTDKKENINLIKLQTELLIKLQSENNLDLILDETLNAVTAISPFDSGGIYLLEGDNLILKNNKGLSDKFVEKVGSLGKNSYQFEILEKKAPIFDFYKNLNIPGNDSGFIEGIKEIALIPLFVDSSLIGSINAAVHNESKISESSKSTLIAIGSILSEILSRVFTYNELKKSEEKFRLVFENELNGYAYHKIITDDNGNPVDYKFINVNKGFTKIVNKKAHEIEGRTVLEVWPETENSWIQKYGEVALKQTKLSFEDYSIALDKYFKVNAYSPVKGHFAVSFSDITERVKNEQDIKKLLTAVEQSQVSIVITNLSGEIEYVNPKFESVTGYKSNEVLGKNPSILKSGKMPAEDYKLLWDEISNGRDWNGIFQNKKKNGELFWESANISPIRNVNGEITHFIAVKEDITEKIKAEEELTNYKVHLEKLVDKRTEELNKSNIQLEEEIRKQKEYDKKLQDQLNMLTTFIDSMPTAAFIKDSELKFIDVNHAFEDLAGLPKEKILGKTVEDIFDSKTAKQLTMQDHKVIKEKRTEIFNLKINSRNNKDRYLLISKAVYYKSYEDFGGILGTYMDISEQKKLQTSIERSLVKEKELNELKSRFISMASHEFRTPLTSIRIFSDLIDMQKEKNDPIKMSEYITKIQDSVAYMTDLINDVLTVSRAETGKLKFDPDTVDFKSFCSEIVNETKLNISEDHNLILQYKTRRRNMLLDSKLIRYIVSNLLTNAVKYSPAGGDIILKVEINNSNLQLSVKDNGIGMSDTVLKNLFEPFLRGDNIGSIPGTGLGLSIIKKSVDLHGGHIRCESKLNKGTSFIVILPIE